MNDHLIVDSGDERIVDGNTTMVAILANAIQFGEDASRSLNIAEDYLQDRFPELSEIASQISEQLQMLQVDLEVALKQVENA